MAISFNGVPANTRVPFTFVEFDNSGAVRGAGVQEFKLLVIGQKTSAGTVAELVPTKVTSAEQAATYFGVGSYLHLMVKALLANDKTHEITVIAVDDAAGGTQAAGKIAFSGTTAAGTLYLYIAGQLVEVAIAAAATPTSIAASVVAAINAKTSLPVTAAVNGVEDTECDLTAKHKGTVGNSIDVRVNYRDGEATPAGLTATVTAMATGATDPDVAEIIAVMTETHYNVIASQFVDSTNLGQLKTELTDRWGPVRQNDGVLICGKQDTHGNLSTLGDSHNSPHVCILGQAGSPTPGWEWAAAAAGQIAKSAQIDPARPLQTLPLVGILPPPESSRFTIEERNLLLYDGISTTNVDADGGVRIERMITTYKTNSLGAADESYLRLESVMTLSYLRYDFRNYMQRKYPRHKLANDGGRYGAGQAIMTPSVGKAEALAKFRDWEELGLVENIDQFKADLIVERNVQNPDRLDFMLPPDLVNQLVVTGVKIGFLL